MRFTEALCEHFQFKVLSVTINMLEERFPHVSQLHLRYFSCKPASPQWIMCCVYLHWEVRVSALGAGCSQRVSWALTARSADRWLLGWRDLTSQKTSEHFCKWALSWQTDQMFDDYSTGLSPKQTLKVYLSVTEHMILGVFSVSFVALYGFDLTI